MCDLMSFTLLLFYYAGSIFIIIIIICRELLAVIDTPVSGNGEPLPGTTVALHQGTIAAHSIGTCRTMKDVPETTAVEPHQRKLNFSHGDIARPSYVFDTHENGGDWKRPAVAGLLYFAGLTCVDEPYFILSQHTIQGNFPTYIKLLQLVLERDLILDDLVRENEFVRRTINIADRFGDCLLFPIEWAFGWDMFDQDIVGNPPSAAAVACHCYLGRGNHGINQK